MFQLLFNDSLIQKLKKTNNNLGDTLKGKKKQKQQQSMELFYKII